MLTKEIMKLTGAIAIGLMVGVYVDQVIRINRGLAEYDRIMNEIFDHIPDSQKIDLRTDKEKKRGYQL